MSCVVGFAQTFAWQAERKLNGGRRGGDTAFLRTISTGHGIGMTWPLLNISAGGCWHRQHGEVLRSSLEILLLSGNRTIKRRTLDCG